MSCASTTERSTEASYLPFDTKIFKQKFEYCFRVMVRDVRVCGSLRFSIVPIIPRHHVDLISHKEPEPERVGWMDLLLIKLGIRVKKYDSRRIDILRRWFHFRNQLNLFIIVREKHAIYLDSVLRFDHERPAVKVLDQHLLQLVIRVK